MRDPRLIIVVGRSETLPDHCGTVLAELNRSLHRVEVVPYDVVGRRASAVLDTVEQYLVVADGASDTGDGVVDAASTP